MSKRPNILWYCTDQQRLTLLEPWGIPMYEHRYWILWSSKAWLLPTPIAKVQFVRQAGQVS